MRIQIDHAWSGRGARVLFGMMVDISLGGAAVRFDGTLPPRTRLSLALPTTAVSRRLRAEVVWTSVIPGQGTARAVYGLRWLQRLEPEVLESLQSLLAPLEPEGK